LKFSFINPEKGEVQGRYPERERERERETDGRRGFTCPNVLKLILIVS